MIHRLSCKHYSSHYVTRRDNLSKSAYWFTPVSLVEAFALVDALDVAERGVCAHCLKGVWDMRANLSMEIDAAIRLPNVLERMDDVGWCPAASDVDGAAVQCPSCPHRLKAAGPGLMTVCDCCQSPMPLRVADPDEFVSILDHALDLAGQGADHWRIVEALQELRDLVIASS